MLITKPRDSEDPRRLQKKLAFAGCNKCPECGEVLRNEQEYNEYRRHLFWYEKSSVTKYICKSCGCHYETDPYDFEPQPVELDESVVIMWFLTISFIVVGFTMSYSDFGIQNLVGIIIYFIGLFIGISWNIIFYLCDNTYKRYTFYDTFTPIERHYELPDLSEVPELPDPNEDIKSLLRMIR